ncbi:major outer membrane protein [Campylobacter lanienae]|uniref:major outer membrane protein n=1 Tax=Campylobacter lanienae TaxID=75658 RepID=UPI00242D24E6|nr:major outer membrane protein [Campylobacter lanienae]
MKIIEGGGYSHLTTSNLSSAGILEETIKNIDISGYSRYRYDSEYNDIEGHINKHRFTSDINFQSALDDNFFGVISFRYDSGDNSGENSDAATQVGTNALTMIIMVKHSMFANST